MAEVDHHHLWLIVLMILLAVAFLVILVYEHGAHIPTIQPSPPAPRPLLPPIGGG